MQTGVSAGQPQDRSVPQPSSTDPHVPALSHVVVGTQSVVDVVEAGTTVVLDVVDVLDPVIRIVVEVVAGVTRPGRPQVGGIGFALALHVFTSALRVVRQLFRQSFWDVSSRQASLQLRSSDVSCRLHALGQRAEVAGTVVTSTSTIATTRRIESLPRRRPATPEGDIPQSRAGVLPSDQRGPGKGAQPRKCSKVDGTGSARRGT